MELRQRRVVSRFVRFGLVALAVVLAAGWFMKKRSPGVDVQVESAAPAVETLAPGDVRIFNEDSTVDVIVAGDRISAGLSPHKIAEVRAQLARSAAKDTAGIGGAIASMVKSQVSDRIGMRMVYPIAEIRDVRYADDGRIMLVSRDGREEALLGSIKVDNEQSNRFRRADAERLIQAVKARQR